MSSVRDRLLTGSYQRAGPGDEEKHVHSHPPTDERAAARGIVHKGQVSALTYSLRCTVHCRARLIPTLCLIRTDVWLRCLAAHNGSACLGSRYDSASGTADDDTAEVWTAIEPTPIDPFPRVSTLLHSPAAHLSLPPILFTLLRSTDVVPPFSSAC